jgi:hypothetical protein
LKERAYLRNIVVEDFNCYQAEAMLQCPADCRHVALGGKAGQVYNLVTSNVNADIAAQISSDEILVSATTVQQAMVGGDKYNADSEAAAW